MAQKLFLLWMSVLSSVAACAQTGTLQVYCPPDVRIYLNDRYQGITSSDFSGLLIDSVAAGDVTVRAVKHGHVSQTKTMVVKEGMVNEVYLDPPAALPEGRFTLGADLHFGIFGLFNVNDAFTKANYSFGVSPYVDYRIHRNFLVGAEVMSMWGKPATADDPRWMLCPNVRFSGVFTPFSKLGFHVLVAGGFSYWPESHEQMELVSTLNDNRFGWGMRAMTGVDVSVTSSSMIRINVGYWASSTTSDDVVWITHDTMLIGLGYRHRL